MAEPYSQTKSSPSQVLNVAGDFEGVAAQTITGGTFNIHYVSTTQSAEDIIKGELIPGPPYKGLEVFEAGDKDNFFGREEWTAKLLNHLNQSNKLLLLGASGSGKSSLIRAGLIPYIRDGYIHEWGTGGFELVMFVPNENPFESLYSSLQPTYGQSKAKFLREVKADTLTKAVDSLQKEKPWLMFIDQFEEMFTSTKDLHIRDAFFSGLVQLIQRQDTAVKLVMTMRSDFYGKLSSYAEFVKELQEAQPSNTLLLTDMSRRDLRLAIQEPAARHHVVFQFQEDSSDYETGARGNPIQVDAVPILVDKIIDDFDKQSGSLPLLQFTLDKLWEKDKELDGLEDQVLNIRSYDALGGVEGALQNYANGIYGALNSPENEDLSDFAGDKQEIARGIFLALIELTDGEPVRRRAEKASFLDDGVKQAVLNHLLKNRLIQSDVHKEQETIEVTHEALLRSWDALQNLVQEYQEDLNLRSRLETDVEQWNDLKQAGKDQEAQAELWDGSKLARVKELQKASFLSQRDEAIERFIQACVTQETLELEQEKAKNAQLQRALTRAEVQVETSKAVGMLSVQPAKGLELTLQTMERELQELPDEKSAAVQVALRQCVARQSIGNPFQGHSAYVLSVAFSPDGQRIVSGSRDETIRLWDLEGNPIGNPFQGHSSTVYSVAFSPDGQRIVSGSDDKTIRLWDLQGNPIGGPFQGHSSVVNSVAFSPDGQRIVSGSNDETIRLWDLQGNPIGEPFQGPSSVFDSVPFIPPDGLGHSVAFSPDGQRIVSSSYNETILLWDLQGNPIGEPFRGHSSAVISVAFSPDGQRIVSCSDDETIRLWRNISCQSWLQTCWRRYAYHAIGTDPTVDLFTDFPHCILYAWSPTDSVRALLRQANDLARLYDRRNDYEWEYEPELIDTRLSGALEHFQVALQDWQAPSCVLSPTHWDSPHCSKADVQATFKLSKQILRRVHKFFPDIANVHWKRWETVVKEFKANQQR